MKKKTYYDALFEQTPEEKALWKEYYKEMDRYKTTSEYIEHTKRCDDLMDKLKKVKEAHRREVKENYRPRRTKLTTKKLDKEAPKREVDPNFENPINEALKAYQALNKAQKQAFGVRMLPYRELYEEYANPKTTKEDLKELLEILVQDTIDFINERELTDIYSVSFGADSLDLSARDGEWTPSTDASIAAYGLGEETINGKTIGGCLQTIGEYF